MSVDLLLNRAAAAPHPRRLVVDAPTRMFHALFALAFAGAWLSADGERWRELHVTLGWTMAGLLGFRVGWGLFGPPAARLAVTWRRIADVPAWLRSAWQTLAERRAPAGFDGRRGHSLLMALTVAMLLALVAPLVLSGWATLRDAGHWVEDLHEALGEAMLAVVLGHLALVAAFSVLRRSNLALPMLTGRVPGAGPDPVRHERRGLAVLLLLAVLAFVGWQWQQSAHGLVPVSAPSAGDRHHHDDHDDD